MNFIMLLGWHVLLPSYPCIDILVALLTDVIENQMDFNKYQDVAHAFDKSMPEPGWPMSR